MSKFYGPEPYKILSRGDAHPEHTFTTVSAAAYLDISDAWLSSLRSEGRGPRFIKVGSRYWYSRADLDQWKAMNSSELPAVRVLGPAPTLPPFYRAEDMPPRDRTQVCPFCADPNNLYELDVYRVVLPPDLATDTNGGYGVLVIKTPCPKKDESR